MPSVQFDAPDAGNIYGGRVADPAWESWCCANLQPSGRDVADIGCGGGIYSVGFARLGAENVIGVDKPEPYVREATAGCRVSNVTFR